MGSTSGAVEGLREGRKEGTVRGLGDLCSSLDSKANEKEKQARAAPRPVASLTL